MGQVGPRVSRHATRVGMLTVRYEDRVSTGAGRRDAVVGRVLRQAGLGSAGLSGHCTERWVPGRS